MKFTYFISERPKKPIITERSGKTESYLTVQLHEAGGFHLWDDRSHANLMPGTTTGRRCALVTVACITTCTYSHDERFNYAKARDPRVRAPSVNVTLRTRALVYDWRMYVVRVYTEITCHGCLLVYAQIYFDMKHTRRLSYISFLVSSHPHLPCVFLSLSWIYYWRKHLANRYVTF